MQSQGGRVFRAFLRELVVSSPRQFSNGSKVIQSSVGMVFRLRCQKPPASPLEAATLPYSKIELLFTQRAGYQKDPNAFNIVFPGGQCDKGEVDLQACKRQLREEIGLEVDQQCLYLGQLPGNFYYVQKRGSKVFISCHVWCLRPEHLAWEPTLNPEQLRAASWVDYEHLLDPKQYVLTNALRLGLIERMALRSSLAASISSHVSRVVLPELDLGMDRNLWGLTLWLWTYSLQMARRNLVERLNVGQDKNEGQRREERGLVEVLGGLSDHAKVLEVEFKPYYPLKYPVLGAIKVWHSLNRVRPFRYQRPSETRAKLILVLVLFSFALLLSLASL